MWKIYILYVFFFENILKYSLQSLIKNIDILFFY